MIDTKMNPKKMDSIQQETTPIDAKIKRKTKEAHFHLDYAINRLINSPNSVTSVQFTSWQGFLGKKNA